MADFIYKPAMPIYWFQVTHDKEKNERLLSELKRLAPWAAEDEIWLEEDEPMTDVNCIVYNHRRVISNEDRYKTFGTMITLIGTEILLEEYE